MIAAGIFLSRFILDYHHTFIIFMITTGGREFQVMAECLLFQNNFRLGARMILDIMDE